MSKSNQFIRIIGDTAEVVTERVERKVALEELLNEVVKDRGLITPILPKGCKLFHQKGDEEIFVVEQSPQIRKITHCNTSYKLAFPYVIFFIPVKNGAIGEIRIFYRTSPLKSVEDKVKKTNLWNVYREEAGMCTGSMRASGDTPAEKAESFIEQFWNVGFNNDITQLFDDAAKQIAQVSSVKKWQEETEKNSLFPIQVSWIDGGKLSDYIKVGG